MRYISPLFLGLTFILGSIAVVHATDSTEKRPLKDVAKASPLIQWPKGFEPASADAYVHNDIWIKAPAAVIWDNLVRAPEWPQWYSNSADVSVDGPDRARLTANSVFRWKTFGFPIQSRVDEFVIGKRLSWFGEGGPDFRAYHTWLIVEKAGGCEVITEETQLGAAAIQFNLAQPTAMFDAHHWWLAALKARCESASHQ